VEKDSAFEILFDASVMLPGWSFRWCLVFGGYQSTCVISIRLVYRLLGLLVCSNVSIRAALFAFLFLCFL
jgi:hypothetical protein